MCLYLRCGDNININKNERALGAGRRAALICARLRFLFRCLKTTISLFNAIIRSNQELRKQTVDRLMHDCVSIFLVGALNLIYCIIMSMPI